MQVIHRLLAAAAAASFIALSACSQASSAGPAVAAIDQASLCVVDNWRQDAVAATCKTGQKVAFLPDSWGNEQLPIMFAALNCDLRFNVALTKGAATCIYGPVTPKPADPAEQPAQTPAR